MRLDLFRSNGHFKFFCAWLGADLIRREVFYLAYHLHWSRSEVMALEIDERRAYVKMLSERIEAENKEFEILSERLKRGR